jgi:phosphoribosyl-AMP cyclohydrolase
VTAIAQDVETKDVLMLAWMNAESLRMTLEEGRMVYWSRSRQELWRKGDTSGDRQFVREAYYDCDGDALLFLVEQEGNGACHTGERSASTGRSAREDPTVARRVPRRSPPTTRSCRSGPRCSATSRHRSRRSPSWSATSPRVPARVGRARRAVEPVLVRRARPLGDAGAP